MTPEERASAVICAAVDALEFRGDPRVGLKLAARVTAAIRAAVEAERELSSDMAKALDELLAVATGSACTHFTDAQIATARAALAKARGRK